MSRANICPGYVDPRLRQEVLAWEHQVVQHDHNCWFCSCTFNLLKIPGFLPASKQCFTFCSGHFPFPEFCFPLLLVPNKNCPTWGVRFWAGKAAERDLAAAAGAARAAAAAVPTAAEPRGPRRAPVLRVRFRPRFHFQTVLSCCFVLLGKISFMGTTTWGPTHSGSEIWLLWVG